MLFKILGSGASAGVPIIGCKCSVCVSDFKQNKRTRSAAVIQNSRQNILIDAGFDIKTQLITSSISKIDAVIITHAHADHICGLPELAQIAFRYSKPIPLYTTAEHAAILKMIFPYLIENNTLKFHIVQYYDLLSFNGIDVQLFKQTHGSISSIGIRIKDLVYANDVSSFPEGTIKYLSDIKYLILDCVGFNSKKGHIGLDTLEYWDKKISPEKIFLTNMSHEICYFKIKEHLPSHISPSYDKMSLEI